MQNARKIRSELPGKLTVRIFYFEYTEKYSNDPRASLGSGQNYKRKGFKSGEINLVFPRTHVLFFMYPDIRIPRKSN